jgi:hypothetical protein
VPYPNEQRWRELAEQAVEEQDEDKFRELIKQLNEVLEDKLQYLKEKNRPYKHLEDTE